MGPRANWKGLLRIGEVSCRVALYTAASTSDRIAFHMINRATGNRVHRQFVDSDTGKVVERDDQKKGYEIRKDEYVVLEPDEIATAIPDSDKILSISAFIACDDVDDVYFDKPYYLAPADREADEAYALIRDGLAQGKVAAIARTVLFRRMRTVLIRAHKHGLIATTLNFDYEVRPAVDAFSNIAALEINSEMLELAEHIIKKKMGKFDISKFDDRYEAALADLVAAKLEGKTIKPLPAPQSAKVVDLMAALRGSADASRGKPRRSQGAGSASRKSGGDTAKSGTSTGKQTASRGGTPRSAGPAAGRKAG